METTKQKVITILVYTEEGMNTQIKNTPFVQEPQKGWLTLEDVEDNSYLVKGLLNIFNLINFNIPIPNEPETGKPPRWIYNTKKLQGIYATIYDKDISKLLEIENDLSSQVKLISPYYGFSIKSDNKDILQPYKLYQQITLSKT